MDGMAANIRVSVSPEEAALAYMREHGDGEYRVKFNSMHITGIVKIDRTTDVRELVDKMVSVGGPVPEGAGETVVEAQPAAGEMMVLAKVKRRR